MESSFVWILMLAGAAVILLGLVLLASERELKTKRRQIEELLAKLESLAAAGAPASSRPQADRAEKSGEQIPNDGEEARQNRDSLLAEVAALRQALDLSEARIRDLEARQQQLPDVETIESQHRREQQNLQERIAALEARLSADQVKISELQSVSARLTEAESAQASLQEEIRRRDAEILRWQAILTAAEEQRQQLAALERPCNELLSKQAGLIEAQRRLQEDLAAFARILTQVRSHAVSLAGNGTAPEDSGTTPEAMPDLPEDTGSKQS